MKPEKVAGPALSVSLAVLILVVSFYTPYFTDVMKPDGHEETYEDLMSYLNGAGAVPEEFSDEEKSHLADVKSLLIWLSIVAYAALVIMLISGFYVYPELRKWSGYGGIGALSFIAIIGLFSVINFSFFWNRIFHPVLFPQGNWLFPSDSLLIQMFPQSSFMTFSYTFLGIALLLSAVAIYQLKSSRS